MKTPSEVFEERLTNALHEIADRSHHMLERPTDRGHGEVTHARRGRLVPALAAAAAVAAIAAGGTLIGEPWAADAPQLAEPGSPTSDTSSGAPKSPRDGYQDAFVWASGLPEGAHSPVAYLAGTTVYMPDGTTIEIPTSGADLIGSAGERAVLLVEPSGKVTDNYYAVVGPGGDVARIDPDVSAPFVQGEILSPDGSRLIQGHQVVDLNTSRQVGTVPDNASVLQTWIPAGAIYAASSGTYWLWNPDTGELRDLGGNLGTFSPGSNAFVRREGNCEVARVVTADGVQKANTFCGVQVVTTSPEGRFGVTSDLRVATGDAATTPLADFPASGTLGQPEIVWVTAHEFLMSVHASDTQAAEDNAGSSVLVSCDVVNATCTRASPVIDADGRQNRISLPGS